eukprot:COSAG04_NODE_29892_length_266_cov_0.610778_1_plen_37_part_10
MKAAEQDVLELVEQPDMVDDLLHTAAGIRRRLTLAVN